MWYISYGLERDILRVPSTFLYMEMINISIILLWTISRVIEL